MTINNYRTSVSAFYPVTLRTQPHAVQLTESKQKGEYIEIGDVPGKSQSHIEKMTHPLACPGEVGHLSPYMIDLLGERSAVAFAEKALQAPRKQLLDRLGIDDTATKGRQAKLNADQKIISRFYTRPAEALPLSITLNGSPFLEQEPTKPYFMNQKIITPDFTIYRDNESAQRTNLLHCKLRDDSAVFFNPKPIKQLESYNKHIYLNESNLRNDGKTLNKAQYFTEMADYLIQRGKPGDFIVQNPLESSSDKNTAHFQYVPGDVPLPIFSHSAQHSGSSDVHTVNWYLPSLQTTIDLQQPDWQEITKKLQDHCQALLDNQHISTTPVFRKLEDGKIDLYMIFKKDCSPAWNMIVEDILSTPGWLEACGIFIADSPKAELFNYKGAQGYYAPYAVSAEQTAAIKELLEH